MIILEK